MAVQVLVWFCCSGAGSVIVQAVVLFQLCTCTDLLYFMLWNCCSNTLVCCSSGCGFVAATHAYRSVVHFMVSFQWYLDMLQFRFWFSRDCCVATLVQAVVVFRLLQCRLWLCSDHYSTGCACVQTVTVQAVVRLLQYGLWLCSDCYSMGCGCVQTVTVQVVTVLWLLQCCDHHIVVRGSVVTCYSACCVCYCYSTGCGCIVSATAQVVTVLWLALQVVTVMVHVVIFFGLLKYR